MNCLPLESCLAFSKPDYFQESTIISPVGINETNSVYEQQFSSPLPL